MYIGMGPLLYQFILVNESKLPKTATLKNCSPQNILVNFTSFDDQEEIVGLLQFYL